MTTLIYRGHTHIPAPNSEAQKPVGLIYRGAHHDGVQNASTHYKSQVQMSYRGVPYTMTRKGRIVPEGRFDARLLVPVAPLGH